VENLRLIAGELQIADVRAQVVLPFATEFQDFTTFVPSPAAADQLVLMLDQVIAWAEALKPLRH
jgi:hypothetical protein